MKHQPTLQNISLCHMHTHKHMKIEIKMESGKHWDQETKTEACCYMILLT